MNDEIQTIVREYRKEQAIRTRTKPKSCFAIDDGYVSMVCDPDMAKDYYKKAKQRICLECYYWIDGRCEKPFGFNHLKAIVLGFLWKLRFKFRPLDWLYCYHFRLMRRRTEQA